MVDRISPPLNLSKPKAESRPTYPRNDEETEDFSSRSYLASRAAFNRFSPPRRYIVPHRSLSSRAPAVSPEIPYTCTLPPRYRDSSYTFREEHRDNDYLIGHSFKSVLSHEEDNRREERDLYSHSYWSPPPRSSWDCSGGTSSEPFDLSVRRTGEDFLTPPTRSSLFSSPSSTQPLFATPPPRPLKRPARVLAKDLTDCVAISKHAATAASSEDSEACLPVSSFSQCASEEEEMSGTSPTSEYSSYRGCNLERSREFEYSASQTRLGVPSSFVVGSDERCRDVSPPARRELYGSYRSSAAGEEEYWPTTGSYHEPSSSSSSFASSGYQSSTGLYDNQSSLPTSLASRSSRGYFSRTDRVSSFPQQPSGTARDNLHHSSGTSHPLSSSASIRDQQQSPRSSEERHISLRLLEQQLSGRSVVYPTSSSSSRSLNRKPSAASRLIVLGQQQQQEEQCLESRSRELGSKPSSSNPRSSWQEYSSKELGSRPSSNRSSWQEYSSKEFGSRPSSSSNRSSWHEHSSTELGSKPSSSSSWQDYRSAEQGSKSNSSSSSCWQEQGSTQQVSKTSCSSNSSSSWQEQGSDPSSSSNWRDRSSTQQGSKPCSSRSSWLEDRSADQSLEPSCSSSSSWQEQGSKPSSSGPWRDRRSTDQGSKPSSCNSSSIGYQSVTSLGCETLEELKDTSNSEGPLKPSSSSASSVAGVGIRRTSSTLSSSSSSSSLAAAAAGKSTTRQSAYQSFSLSVSLLSCPTPEPASKEGRLADYLADCLIKYGVCIVDGYMGSRTGMRIFKDVKERAAQLREGRLMTDELESHTVRGDETMWLDAGASPHVDNLVHRLDSVMRALAHRLDATYQITSRTKAMIARYSGSGKCYVRHVDNHRQDGRCITCIYYLNQNYKMETDGGLLRMYPSRLAQSIDVEPKFDRVIFFWSDHRTPHEVLPAFKERYAITVWYFDENERQQAKQRMSSSQASGTSAES